MIHHKIEGLNS